MVLVPRGVARTFLIHFVIDKPKARRRPRRTIVPLKAVEKMRPGRDEIVIAIGLKLHNCGVQLWGWTSLGLFTDRRQRG